MGREESTAGTQARAYALAASVACLLALGTVAALNAVVDPHDTVRLTQIEGWTDWKITSPPHGGRAVLSLQLDREDYRGLLVGTSRTRFGFGRNDPQLQQRQIKNAALPGTNMIETAEVVDFVLERRDIETLLLGLDFLAFRGDKEVGGDFDASAFSGRSTLRVRAGRLLSSELLEDSIGTIQRSRARLRENAEPRDDPPVATKIPAFASFSKMLRSYAVKHYACLDYDPGRIEVLRTLLERVTSRGVQTYLFFPPLHASQLGAIGAAGLLPTYDRWRSDIARAVADVQARLPDDRQDLLQLWDFGGYSDYTSESLWKNRPSKWYYESSHFRPTLGAELLSRMFGDPDADKAFGVRVRPGPPPTGHDRSAAQLARWAAERPEDARLVARIFRTTVDQRKDCAGSHDG